jgi:hypothetical protein
MVMAIVFITAITKISRARYQALGAQQHGAVQSADAMRHADEMRALKERVAVLERVITDNHGSLGLDREIERLRDR